MQFSSRRQQWMAVKNYDLLSLLAGYPFQSVTKIQLFCHEELFIESPRGAKGVILTKDK